MMSSPVIHNNPIATVTHWPAPTEGWVKLNTNGQCR